MLAQERCPLAQTLYLADSTAGCVPDRCDNLTGALSKMI
jgi:hypothetical protein